MSRIYLVCDDHYEGRLLVPGCTLMRLEERRTMVTAHLEVWYEFNEALEILDIEKDLFPRKKQIEGLHD